MFESFREPASNRIAITGRMLAIGSLAPLVLTMFTLAWAALLSHAKGEGVLGLPFAIWIFGLAIFGAGGTFIALSKCDGTLVARIGLTVAIWIYVLAVTWGGFMIGFVVLSAAAGVC